MTVSRYQTTIPEAERQRLFSVIEKLPRQPSEGDPAWEAFMTNTIRLPLCYLDGVRKVIDQGRWKAKLDPVGFIHKCGQLAAFAPCGLAEDRENRTQVYVGRAIDDDQKRPPTLEESLRFDPPKRRPKVYAGNVADLKLPRLLETNEAGSHRITHDEVVGYFWRKSGRDLDSYVEPRWRDIDPDLVCWEFRPGAFGEFAARDVAPDLMCSDGPEFWNDPDVWVQKLDLDRLAVKVGLDKDERMVLKCKFAGESRDSLMARQKTAMKRLAVQAAWKRVDRKWRKIIESIKAPPTSAEVTVPPAARVVPADAPTAIEVLRRHQENRPRDANNEPHHPIALPVYPEYSR
jgi:hypothetical protein